MRIVKEIKRRKFLFSSPLFFTIFSFIHNHSINFNSHRICSIYTAFTATDILIRTQKLQNSNKENELFHVCCFLFDCSSCITLSNHKSTNYSISLQKTIECIGKLKLKVTVKLSVSYVDIYFIKKDLMLFSGKLSFFIFHLQNVSNFV